MIYHSYIKVLQDRIFGFPIEQKLTISRSTLQGYASSHSHIHIMLLVHTSPYFHKADRVTTEIIIVPYTKQANHLLGCVNQR